MKPSIVPKNLLTLYGRKVVFEILNDSSIEIYKLHLSESNKSASILDEIIKKANSRQIPIAYHSKKRLSFISKNSKQDQGVAVDILLPKDANIDALIGRDSYRIMVLDGITNPQNLGMIVRSCAAGSIDAIVLPHKGSAKIEPLSIKASAGTMFKIPIVSVESLARVCETFAKDDADIYVLDSHAKEFYDHAVYGKKTVFVLGNESDGVSKEVRKVATKSIAIKMNRGVESLNVAVTASLLSFGAF